MNKQIEALKMIIDWIEKETRSEYTYVDILKACKEALAEAEKQDDIEKQLDYAHARGFKEGAENAYKKMEHSTQEPVAWMEEYQSCKVNGDERLCHSDKVFRLVQVLASQLDEWQSLSDDEIASVIKTTFPVNIGVTNVDLKFARAIEQSLRSKNDKSS